MKNDNKSSGTNKYSIVVSDFDDTLLRSDGTISEFTKQTVSDFVARGGTFLIATGRMTRSALAEARRLGLKGQVISYQGGMINDIESGETLFHSPIPAEGAAFNLARMEEHEGQVHAYIDDVLYVRRNNDYTREYERALGVLAVETHVPLSQYVSERGATPTKLLMIAHAEIVRELVTELTEKHGDEFYYCMSKPVFFEVTKAGVNKGEAVAMTAEKMGKTMSDVLAVGDSLNDLPMIERAGLGCAVANALPEVLQKARVTGESNDDDGVAKLILKYGI